MNGYQIFEKYWDGLVITAVDSRILTHDAVRLALRLAIHEAAGAQHDDTALVVAQNEAAMLRQRLAAAEEEIGNRRQAEVDRAQVATLNEWLADEEPALYHDPYTDTAQAVLAAIRKRDEQITGLQREIASLESDVSRLGAKLQAAEQGWAAAQADADRLALQVAQQPIAVHVNGNGAGAVDPTPAAAPVTGWGRNHPAWQGLAAPEREELYAVIDGDKSWRRLPKELRRILAVRAISYLQNPSMSEFDRQRPTWMPTSNTLSTTLDDKWSNLVNSIPA